MKTNKKFWLLAVLFSAMFFASPLKAQVTIGDETPPHSYSVLELISKYDTSPDKYGGLRLPQLTTDQRDGLNLSSSDPAAKGLVIFNTTNTCVEYWNNLRWVSLCSGNADFIFWDDNNDPVDPTVDPNNNFPWEGETKGPWTPEGIPSCNAVVPYSINVVAGGDYTWVTVLNQSNGRFTLTMNENPTARIRTAIIRVTNNCTGEYKDYLFTQDANDALCNGYGSVLAPNIVAYGDNKTACSGGAVYMYITNYDPAAVYIWTYNDVEIARGRWWYADKKGTYRVYVGAVGCAKASNPLEINLSATIAPAPAPDITAENDGIFCSGMPSLALTASNYGADPSKVFWFRDGVRVDPGEATKYVGSTQATVEGNDWIAVVSDGSCYSLPSNIIRVRLNPSSTALTVPNVTINELNMNAVTYCKGGVLNITITNMSAYAGMTVNFIFKNGTEVLSVTKIDDSHYQYVIPPETNTMLFSVTAQDITGTYCSRSNAQSSPVTLTSVAPSKPIITSSTGFLICGNTPATLNTVTGMDSYEWYKDGVKIPTATGSSFTTGGSYGSGKYSVAVGSGGCTSDRSDEVEVKQGSGPNLDFFEILGPLQVNKDETRTYTVSFQEPGVTFEWQDDFMYGAYVVGSRIGPSASYLFSTVTDPNTSVVWVKATNACGTTGKGVGVKVMGDCTPPTITGGTPAGAVINLFVGQTLNLSVNTSGTSPTFQWHKTTGTNSGAISGATSAVYTIPSVALTDAGTYNVVVTGSGTCSGYTEGLIDDIIVIVNENPGGFPLGLGTFTGKTCFDVVETNPGGSCGDVNGRMSQKANFALSGTYIQTYTFTPVGSVSNIRFYAIDQTGQVIDFISYVPGSYIVTVNYKQDLNIMAKGRDRANALTAMLYVVYDSGGYTYRRELKVSVQDCSCCPGYLAVGKEYVQTTPGYLDGDWGQVGTFTGIINSHKFTATNRDVCFYKTDYGLAMSLTSAKTYCSYTFDGLSDWRLPTIAELGSIQSVATSLSSQPTSVTGTQNMSNYPVANQNAYYYSSTERGSSTYWGWSYGQAQTQIIQNFNMSQHVRCVRTQ